MYIELCERATLKEERKERNDREEMRLTLMYIGQNWH